MKAIVNGKLWTVTQGVIDNGTVLIEDGKIKSVGVDIIIPDGTEIIDAQGRIVTPGLIDAHVHAGICEEGVPGAMNAVNEDTSPTTPALRALDGVNPSDEAFTNAREAGITCLQVLPGSANIIGGTGVILKTKENHVVDEMIVKEHSGMKAALGENPVVWQGGKGRFPSTRMGNAACMRKIFKDAFDYRNKKEEAAEKGESFVTDQGMENFLPVLCGDVPVRIHSHRADDICTAIRICEEFGLRYTIEHCTEGQFISDYLAEKGVRAAVGPTATSKTKVEVQNKGWETLLALKEAGVPFCLITDHPVIPVETLTVAGALAMRAGLDAQTTLEAVTINAARHLEIEDRVGSIEEGKDADLVIWTGDPFDVRNKPVLTLINGE